MFAPLSSHGLGVSHKVRFIYLPCDPTLTLSGVFYPNEMKMSTELPALKYT